MNETQVGHRTLGAITQQVDDLRAISKTALRFGDRVLVQTLNSTYSIQVLQDGQYAVSGGWFDKEGLSPLKTTINGCTFGGSAIKVDIVAADGLHLEFGNSVITSRIRWFEVVRFESESVN